MRLVLLLGLCGAVCEVPSFGLHVEVLDELFDVDFEGLLDARCGVEMAFDKGPELLSCWKP